MTMNVALATTVKALVAQNDDVGHGLNFADLKGWVTQTNAAYCITSDNYTDVKRIPATVTTLPLLREWIDTLHAAIAAGEKEEMQKNGTLRSYKVTVCCVHMMAVTMDVTTGWWTDHANHSLGSLAKKIMAQALENEPDDLGANAKKLWKATCNSDNTRVKNMLVAILQMCPAVAPTN